MTSRGFASLQVAAGLPEVLTCPWVADHAVEVEPAGGTLQALADDVAALALTCSNQGYDSGVIDLDGVNWFDDADLTATAPQASWQAFLGADTEQPGLWLAYTPTTGLVEGSHVDHDVMIPVEWADPATRTEIESAQLARITEVRATLAQIPPARGPGALSTAAPVGQQAAEAGSLNARMATPATPVAGATPTTSATPRGRGVSR